ncbi:MAG: hypothetical protein AB8G77_01985 [Rhodothermales bacterium]
MDSSGENGSAKIAQDAMLVSQLTKALLWTNVDEVVRIRGRYLDKHRLQVSTEVLQEYEVAGRIKQA